MIKEIVVRFIDGGEYLLLDDSWVCQHIHPVTETFTDYWPSQEQIDRGTDQDEEYQVTFCLDCGERLDD